MRARVMTALLALAALFLVLPAPPAYAVNPDEVLADPVLETRAREISKELRCLVCQNQSIDDSNAPLARDLRIIVRERLEKGDSDNDVIDFVVARYGEFVLLRPPFRGATVLLWLGPAMIAALGLFAIVLFFRRRAVGAGAPVVRPLSDDEKRRLDRLLDGDGPGDGQAKHGEDSP